MQQTTNLHLKTETYWGNIYDTFSILNYYQPRKEDTYFTTLLALSRIGEIIVETRFIQNFARLQRSKERTHLGYPHFTNLKEFSKSCYHSHSVLLVFPKQTKKSMGFFTFILQVCIKQIR